MEMIVFSGIQASGKTTFYRLKFWATHLRLSLDMLGTRNRENMLLYACLAARQPVVIDNTNPTADQRKRYCRLAKASEFRATLYFFDVDIDIALTRNSNRPDHERIHERIPEIGLRGTFAKLELPTAHEGFDSIFIVKATTPGDFTVEEVKHEI
jgi:predicted kinase